MPAKIHPAKKTISTAQMSCHEPKCPPNEVVADGGFFLQRLPVPYNAAMDPHDIRIWAENHRAAAAREAAEARKNPMTADQAFASVLALLAFDEKQNGSPFERRDPVSDREDEEMWSAWTKLRARWPKTIDGRYLRVHGTSATPFL
jgi:hypothetical protein